MKGTITDRQERIPGFQQDLLNNARIAIIGAGRTGNEVAKNAALTGIGGIFSVDMDHVSDTNLPGTVLFTRADVGSSKAMLVAEGLRKMHVGEHPSIDWIDADVCYELGEGLLNHYDIIINCVDNLQTRLHLARVSKLLGKPCIDTGIDGFDWTIFTSSGDTAEACYACTMTEEEEEAALSRVRNSCDVTLRKAINTGKAATIITSASQVGALAIDRAIKILHHKKAPNLKEYDPLFDRMMIFTSSDMRITKYKYSRRCTCTNHISYADFGGVIKTPLSASNTVRETLLWVKRQFGDDYYLSLLKDCAKLPHAFITTAKCTCCGKPIDVFMPQFKVEEKDLLCKECFENGSDSQFPSSGIRMFDFSLEGTEDRILNMTLQDIGIPLFHIVEIDSFDETKNPLFLELTGDMPKLLPELYKNESAMNEVQYELVKQ